MASQDDFASFMEHMEQTPSAPLRQLKKGERVKGRVVHIGADSVFVDLGSRADGRVPRLELQRPDGTLPVKVGDMLEATVADPLSNEGPLLVVTLGQGGGLDLSELKMALETGTPVEGRFSKAVKGGLEVTIGGTRAFCPASLASNTFVSELESLVGQTLRVAVLEIKEDGRSVIVSRRAVIEQERAEMGAARMTELKEGAIISGQVTSLQKFGAFVDLGGVEGLVHISEITHGHVDRVEDVLSQGEQVQVKVLKIELPEDTGGKQGARIALSMKALTQSSQPSAPGKDEVLEAKVVKHLQHGIVVSTKKGEGIVPTRELDVQEGRDLRRAYPLEETLEVVLLDASRGKLRFSATKVSDVQARNDFRDYRKQQSASGGGGGGALAAALGKLDLGPLPAGPSKAELAKREEAERRVREEEQAAHAKRQAEMEAERQRALAEKRAASQAAEAAEATRVAEAHAATRPEPAAPPQAAAPAAPVATAAPAAPVAETAPAIDPASPPAQTRRSQPKLAPTKPVQPKPVQRVDLLSAALTPSPQPETQAETEEGTTDSDPSAAGKKGRRRVVRSYDVK